MDIRRLGLYKIKVKIMDGIHANLKVQILPLNI